MPRSAPEVADQVRGFEEDLIASAKEPAPSAPPAPTFDSQSERLLKTLRPDLEPLAREHLFTMRQTGADARVVQGSRTLKQQAIDYAKGRTVPGQIVTNAPPGTSAHNFGAAYDIGLFQDGRMLPSSPLYTTIGPAAAPPGINWGNNIPGFPAGDLGHYQLPNWRSLPNLQQFH